MNIAFLNAGCRRKRYQLRGPPHFFLPSKTGQLQDESLADDVFRFHPDSCTWGGHMFGPPAIKGKHRTLRNLTMLLSTLYILQCQAASGSFAARSLISTTANGRTRSSPVSHPQYSSKMAGGIHMGANMFPVGDLLEVHFVRIPFENGFHLHNRRRHKSTLPTGGYLLTGDKPGGKIGMQGMTQINNPGKETDSGREVEELSDWKIPDHARQPVALAAPASPIP